jgi:hypothetical protein
MCEPFTQEQQSHQTMVMKILLASPGTKNKYLNKNKNK